MNDVNLSAELELALLAVLKNVRTASAKVAELQETPDFEPKMLALHSRALAVQVTALRTLTTVMAKLTPAEKPAETPAPPALRQEILGRQLQELSELRDEFAALQHDLPGIFKNFSPPPASLPAGEGLSYTPPSQGGAGGGWKPAVSKDLARPLPHDVPSRDGPGERCGPAAKGVACRGNFCAAL